MRRKIVIEGNSVYELDEECMLRKQLTKECNENQREKKIRSSEYPGKVSDRKKGESR